MGYDDAGDGARGKEGEESCGIVVVGWVVGVVGWCLGEDLVDLQDEVEEEEDRCHCFAAERSSRDGNR